MFSKLLIRLIFGGLLLLLVLLYDARGYVQQNFLDPNSGKSEGLGSQIQSLVTGAREFFAQRTAFTGSQVPLKGKLYPVYLTEDETGFLIEYKSKDIRAIQDNNLGAYYVVLDSSGIPAQSKRGTRIYSVDYSHQEAFWYQSFTRRLYLHYVLAAFFLLGSLRDLFAGRRESKSSSVKPQVDREREGKKLFAVLEKALKKGNQKKILDLIEKKKIKDYLPRDLEKAELILGKAYHAIGDSDSALPVLRRYASKNRKDPEVREVLGAYFIQNPKDARIQDLPYLLAALEDEEASEEIEGLVSSLFLKHKIKDRKSLHSISRVCLKGGGDAELAEHILTTLVEFKDTDEEAQAFYQYCKNRNPEDPRPLLMLAESDLAAGRFHDALTYLEPLLNMDYENQSVHEMLFKIYEVLERLEELFQVYQSILSQHPEEPIALAQHRAIRNHPDFKQDEAQQGSSLSVEELLAKGKEGKADIESELLKKYERTLTILFTDIEGYTRMSESQSIVETMSILQESDQIIAPVIKRHEGIVIKKIGDAYMARFDSADSALMTGIQVQQAIHANNLKRKEAGQITWNIRIGINTGRVIVKDGDVFGDAVNIASRVESNARSGEVYCTRETMEKVDPNRFRFESRDRRRVKGKSDPIELLAVLFDASGDDA